MRTRAAENSLVGSARSFVLGCADDLCERI